MNWKACTISVLMVLSWGLVPAMAGDLTGRQIIEEQQDRHVADNETSKIELTLIDRKGKEKHQVQARGIEDLAPFKYKVDRIILKRLKQAGIPLLLSTDAGTGGMGIVPGFFFFF